MDRRRGRGREGLIEGIQEREGGKERGGEEGSGMR